MGMTPRIGSPSRARDFFAAAQAVVAYVLQKSQPAAEHERHDQGHAQGARALRKHRRPGRLGSLQHGNLDDAVAVIQVQLADLPVDHLELAVDPGRRGLQKVVFGLTRVQANGPGFLSLIIPPVFRSCRRGVLPVRFRIVAIQGRHGLGTFVLLHLARDALEFADLSIDHLDLLVAGAEAAGFNQRGSLTLEQRDHVLSLETPLRIGQPFELVVELPLLAGKRREDIIRGVLSMLVEVIGKRLDDCVHRDGVVFRVGRVHRQAKNVRRFQHVHLEARPQEAQGIGLLPEVLGLLH